VGEVVSSYATDDSDRLLVLDPLAPPSRIDELATGRETAIALTCPWQRARCDQPGGAARRAALRAAA